MSSEGAFDFTESEIYQALRLRLLDTEAREQARSVAAAATPGLDWATSEELLLLLALGSESGREKVQRLRHEEQSGRFSTWVRQERASGAESSPDQFQRRWRTVVDAEDQVWEERLESAKRALE